MACKQWKVPIEIKALVHGIGWSDGAKERDIQKVEEATAEIESLGQIENCGQRAGLPFVTYLVFF